MNRIVVCLIGILALGVSATSPAEHVRGYTKKNGTHVHSYERHSKGTAPHHSSSSKTHVPKTSAPGDRDTHGKLARSSSARATFERFHPCPSTGKTSGACPGYVVDHVVPLKRGGADAPSNMRWQTVEAAKQKDKTE
jgi:hypothetical protein